MISCVYDKEQIRRLDEKKIIIELQYTDYGFNSFLSSLNKEYFIRYSNGFRNDQIVNKKLKRKRYYSEGQLLYEENNFNSDLIYNIENFKLGSSSEDICCPNCGYKDNIKKFSDGCPYCRTSFNIGANRLNKITNSSKKKKNLFKKKINKKLNNKFTKFIITFAYYILPLYILISQGKDLKIIIAVIAAMTIILLILIKCVKNVRKKMKIKANNKPWLIRRAETDFYKSLGNILSSKIFSYNKEIIDFDFMDLVKLDFVSEDEIKVTCVIREVYFNNNITSVNKNYELTMKYNNRVDNINNNNDLYKVIKCESCGASIDINDDCCKYCGQKFDKLNKWIITNINII